MTDLLNLRSWLALRLEEAGIFNVGTVRMNEGVILFMVDEADVDKANRVIAAAVRLDPHGREFPVHVRAV